MADLFKDGFESGDLTAWSNSVTDGGDLSAHADATLHGSYGLNLFIDDQTAIYVYDITPNTEARYRCRFYIDPNLLTMAVDDYFGVVEAFYEDWSAVAFNVYLMRRAGPVYTMGFQDYTDGAWSVYFETEISDAPHCVEVDWKRATGAGQDDGHLKVWIDGVLVYSNTAVDNDTENVGNVIFGADGVDAGTSGTFYLDDFASNNDGSEIGLIANRAKMSVAIMNHL